MKTMIIDIACARIMKRTWHTCTLGNFDFSNERIFFVKYPMQLLFKTCAFEFGFERVYLKWSCNPMREE